MKRGYPGREVHHTDDSRAGVYSLDRHEHKDCP